MENRKPTLLALSQFIHHHLLWFLISAYAIAAVFPAAGLWIRNVNLGDVPHFPDKDPCLVAPAPPRHAHV